MTTLASVIITGMSWRRILETTANDWRLGPAERGGIMAELLECHRNGRPKHGWPAGWVVGRHYRLEMVCPVQSHFKFKMSKIFIGPSSVKPRSLLWPCSSAGYCYPTQRLLTKLRMELICVTPLPE